MKLWTLSTLCAASLLIISGCATTPKPTEEVKVDSTLPMVKLTQNGVIVDMKTVAFEWNSVNDPRVEGVYVYKQSFNPEKESALEYYATINNRFQTHYLDQNVEPDTKYNYSFRTFSKDAEGVESKVVAVNTLPVLTSVSWIHSITGMPRSAKIIWRPHSNNRVKSYIIERKTLEDEKWDEIGTIKGRLNAEYIDQELKDNYVYMYRIRAHTYDGITSTPSEIVKVVTKALPQTITNIHATKNLPKKIKLEWDPSTEEDFERYYVYRSESVDGSYTLVAKLYNNRFVDVLEEDGKSYFYRVSAVDKDGLESEHERSSIQGMSLIRPNAPAIVEAKLVGSNIEIVWSKIDNRTTSYVVAKTHQRGWFDKTREDYEGITTQRFIDKNVVANSKYSYVVYSVDKNGIKSKPSIEVKIETPESNEIESAPVQKAQKEVKSVPKSAKTEEILSPIEDIDINEL
jgi:uncharacterized protein